MEQNLSQYRIFYTVALEGNISRAAEALFISQPAISKSIRKLEESLETTLFLRNSRGVQLTEEGKLLFHHVKEAFDTLRTGEEQLRQIHALGIGHLRIGVSTTLCKYLLLPYLKPFIQAFPHVRITISCQSTAHTLSLLKDEKIDVGLVGTPSHTGAFAFESLGKIEDIFVATPQYIENLNLRKNSGETILDSATLMLLDKENLTRQYIDTYFQNNHLHLTNLLEVSTMDLLIDFARIGLGVACVIRDFVKKELENQELLEIPLPVPIPSREVGFLYGASELRNPALRDFLEFCQDYPLPPERLLP
ncbi:MAG: LysR family transcriptional regulator [Candidatus Limivivens sp.]|nr:LysR family transcriptional regulator [Candidatus Limivivens sp.]